MMSLSLKHSPGMLTDESALLARVRIRLHGMLQGMGFRPFVCREARQRNIRGWVRNTTEGLLIDAEGEPPHLEEFIHSIKTKAPQPSRIEDIQIASLPLCGLKFFTIEGSIVDSELSTLPLPDLATCADCLKELLDPANRRYRYPFITCTQCGPRFTIIESLPYDRARTTMKTFTQCKRCQAEYDSPEDRRFHSQPNACPDCGPSVELQDPQGEMLCRGEKAIETLIERLKKGNIIAAKGIGGYHLLADATHEKAVARLRTKKGRPDKPLALLMPSLQQVMVYCHVNPMEEKMLTSQAGPLVLLHRKTKTSGPGICDGVAPQNPRLAVMLPSNPLHHLIGIQMDRPLVATSGNFSEDVICVEDDEARERLGSIADAFLVHDRPIHQHADDSIVQVLNGQPQMLRRARGYAPWPIQMKKSLPNALALGGHLKNTLALGCGNKAIISQHLGDLSSVSTRRVFSSKVDSMAKGFPEAGEFLICDLHPDYHSTVLAVQSPAPVLQVQHHVAHVFSNMAEHDLLPPLLGVAWDGSGYGPDGTIWGGEFFKVTAKEIRRVATFRPFSLPGGETAIKEPRRALLGLLHAWEGGACFERPELQKQFSSHEIPLLEKMLAQNLNTPQTTSCGRLFDAFSCLLGGRPVTTFEGQAAMELEFASIHCSKAISYPVHLIPANAMEFMETRKGKIMQWNPEYFIDWAPWLEAIFDDLGSGVSVEVCASRFHATLAATVAELAKRFSMERVVLSGGCFQNVTLSQLTLTALKSSGHRPYVHKTIPPNDGGLSLGQLAFAAWLHPGESD